MEDRTSTDSTRELDKIFEIDLSHYYFAEMREHSHLYCFEMGKESEKEVE